MSTWDRTEVGIEIVAYFPTGIGHWDVDEVDNVFFFLSHLLTDSAMSRLQSAYTNYGMKALLRGLQSLLIPLDAAPGIDHQSRQALSWLKDRASEALAREAFNRDL